MLQPLCWRCAECAVHHERNMREEHHLYVARTSNNRVIAACDLHCCLLFSDRNDRTLFSSFVVSSRLSLLQRRVAVSNAKQIKFVLQFLIVSLHYGFAFCAVVDTYDLAGFVRSTSSFRRNQVFAAKSIRLLNWHYCASVVTSGAFYVCLMDVIESRIDRELQSWYVHLSFFCEMVHCS